MKKTTGKIIIPPPTKEEIAEALKYDVPIDDYVEGARWLDKEMRKDFEQWAAQGLDVKKNC